METLLYDCAQAVAHIECNVAIKARGEKPLCALQLSLLTSHYIPDIALLTLVAWPWNSSRKQNASYNYIDEGMRRSYITLRIMQNQRTFTAIQ